MPFDNVLANLLSINDGAVGVLFLDDSGETVGSATGDYEPQAMKLLGAYVGIYLRQVKRFLEPEHYGELQLIHIENRGLHVFARPLPDGYFVLLAQRTPALTAVARASLEDARSLLGRELFDEV